MALSRIVMRLARNPGTEFADGDDNRGYTLTAPLTADGHIDEAALKALKGGAPVRHFAPDEDTREGRLGRRGEHWFFDFGEDDEAREPLYHLAQHRFAIGEYLSISDEDGRLLTYKVTEVAPTG
jgi:hypothetical protein